MRFLEFTASLQPGWALPCALTLLLAACDASAPGDDGTSALGADLLSAGEAAAEATDQAAMSRAQAPPASLAAPSRAIPMSELGHTAGEAEAPIRIVEFSDFGCGYCRRFHMETFPTLEEEYIETGKVQWKYVPMVLGMFGPTAVVAAHAGECAMAQNRFAPMRDRLFEDQSEWKGAGDVMAVLEGYAEDAGLDVGEWRQCVTQESRQDRIASGTAAAFEAGVRGTPSFFILGYAPIPGALPLDVFRQVLDTVYADVSAR